MLEGLGDMLHNGGIHAQACHQQEVMLGFGCCFYLSLTYLLLSIILGYARECKPLHIDIPYIHLASFTVDEDQSGLHRVMGHANFSCPDIGSAAGNDSDDTPVPLDIHHAIEDLVHCSIATIANNQIVVVFCRPGG